MALATSVERHLKVSVKQTQWTKSDWVYFRAFYPTKSQESFWKDAMTSSSPSTEATTLQFTWQSWWSISMGSRSSLTWYWIPTLLSPERFKLNVCTNRFSVNMETPSSTFQWSGKWTQNFSSVTWKMRFDICTYHFIDYYIIILARLNSRAEIEDLIWSSKLVGPVEWLSLLQEELLVKKWPSQSCCRNSNKLIFFIKQAKSWILSSADLWRGAFLRKKPPFNLWIIAQLNTTACVKWDGATKAKQCLSSYSFSLQVTELPVNPQVIQPKRGKKRKGIGTEPGKSFSPEALLSSGSSSCRQTHKNFKYTHSSISVGASPQTETFVFLS